MMGSLSFSSSTVISSIVVLVMLPPSLACRLAEYIERISRSRKDPFLTSTAPVVAFTMKICWLQHTQTHHWGSSPGQTAPTAPQQLCPTYMYSWSSW